MRDNHIAFVSFSVSNEMYSAIARGQHTLRVRQSPSEDHARLPDPSCLPGTLRPAGHRRRGRLPQEMVPMGDPQPAGAGHRGGPLAGHPTLVRLQDREWPARRPNSLIQAAKSPAVRI
jgi:hypothetical protein